MVLSKGLRVPSGDITKKGTAGIGAAPKTKRTIPPYEERSKYLKYKGGPVPAGMTTYKAREEQALADSKTISTNVVSKDALTGEEGTAEVPGIGNVSVMNIVLIILAAGAVAYLLKKKGK